MPRFNLHTEHSLDTDELSELTTFYGVGSADVLWPVGKEPTLRTEDMLQLVFKDERKAEPICGEDARKVRDRLEAVGFVLRYARIV